MDEELFLSKVNAFPSFILNQNGDIAKDQKLSTQLGREQQGTGSKGALIMLIMST